LQDKRELKIIFESKKEATKTIQNFRSAVDSMYSTGKTPGFTSSFMNIMYQDNSIFAASRKKVKSPIIQKNKDYRTILEVEKLEKRERMRQICQIFEEKFKIISHPRDIMKLSEEQLFIKLRLKHFHQIELMAAKTIQKFARMIIKRVKWVKIVSISSLFIFFLVLIKIKLCKDDLTKL
jgi:hypothetical protein